MKYVLTIAGSDTSGGAGIQADVKTITHLGAHALTVITALTAQNSLGINAIQKIPVRFISSQFETIFEDVTPDAVKTGMLLSGAVIKQVARVIRKHDVSPFVVDPVLKASTGRSMMDPEAVSLLKTVLLPLASIVTPNLEEAEVLSGRRVRTLSEMTEAAKAIKSHGPDVVITGGHLKDQCVDLYYDGKASHRFSGTKIDSAHTHGTGCVFSSALATYLAQGCRGAEATERAHLFTRSAIRGGYPCGRGAGPVRPGAE
ncbi:MAG: bifunctional hydroxymethylpyrimidine kinase/phosphomethylpyrimidine kinase [Deltaproteobacteria bacterium]|nr:bifunctional hydroxymethylpyrimidine kinase/phosphomethylpyrimidine kinase [Deltaproteobacteria bacterium]